MSTGVFWIWELATYEVYIEIHIHIYISLFLREPMHVGFLYECVFLYSCGTCLIIPFKLYHSNRWFCFYIALISNQAFCGLFKIASYDIHVGSSWSSLQVWICRTWLSKDVMPCETSHWIFLVVGRIAEDNCMTDTCSAGTLGSKISAEHWLADTNTPGNPDHQIEVEVQPNIIPLWTLTLKSSVWWEKVLSVFCRTLLL